MKKLLFAALAFGAVSFGVSGANASPLAASTSAMANQPVDAGIAVEQVRHRWNHHHYGTYYHPPHDSRYWTHQRTYRRGHLHRGWGPNHPHW